MPRFFYLPEAERLLPQVEPVLRNIIDRKQEFEQSDRELDALTSQIAAAGGMIPPRERMADLRERKKRCVEALGASLEKLEDTGCLLKDADIGLVDFPTLYRGAEVYLCWKLGETGISHWHHVEDGFRGRRAIDSDFMANHRGET